MNGETQYTVIAKSKNEKNAILSIWEDPFAINEEENSFCGCATTVYDVMTYVIKADLNLKALKQLVSFKVVGKLETDEVCSVFEIQYDSKAPLIRAMRGDADLDEETYSACMAAFDEDISKLLVDKKAWTFKDAIDGIEDTLSDEELEAYYAEDSDEDLDLQDCFGGYMEMPYEEWVAEVLNDMDEGFEEDWDEEE